MRRLTGTALLFAGLTATAWANPIDITGSSLVGSFTRNLSFSGPGLSFSYNALGPSRFRTCYNTATTPCDLSVTFIVSTPLESLSTTFDGQTLVNNPLCPSVPDCGTLTGQVTFSAEPFLLGVNQVPPLVPTTVSGEIKAVYDNGQQLYDLAISGSGTVSVDQAAPPFVDALVSDLGRFSFSGTATLVPEPSTAALLASGLLVAAGWRFVRRAVARSRS
jgi:hypothetical protein